MKESTYNRGGDVGRFVLVGSALAFPLISHSRTAVARVAATFLGVVAVSKLCKAAIPERRPNGADYDSFPSQHAAEAFAAAAMIDGLASRGVGTSGWLLAGAVSVSRVLGRKHHPLDVVVGIGLGLAAARTGSAVTAADDRAIGMKRA